MTVKQHSARGRPGDWLQAKGLPGCPSRLGQIVEVIRTGGCEREPTTTRSTSSRIASFAIISADSPSMTVVVAPISVGTEANAWWSWRRAMSWA